MIYLKVVIDYIIATSKGLIILKVDLYLISRSIFYKLLDDDIVVLINIKSIRSTITARRLGVKGAANNHSIREELR